MKPKISISVCILISLALVLFGLIYGTVSGFADDRAQVTALLNGESGLMSVLNYRAADGFNLCVVARRHLAKDADVTRLETASRNLQVSGGSLSAKKQEDAKLSAAAALVGQKLKETPSFQQSARDKAYLEMLVTDMEQLSQTAVADTYNNAAKDFNRLLDAPLSGALAQILGVKPCELYQ